MNFGVPSRYLKALIADPKPLAIEAFAAAEAAAHGRAAPGLPDITRNIPHHEITILQGCSDDDQRIIARGIFGAIEIGAPLYNQGAFAACFHMYEGAAVDIERKLPASCQGPRRALEQARNRAATLADPAPQAWAMRDGFDGLLDVIARAHQVNSP